MFLGGLGPSWGHLGAILGRLRAILGLSLAHLEQSWADLHPPEQKIIQKQIVFQQFWVHPGAIGAHSRDIRGPLGAILEPTGASPEPSGDVLGHTWCDLASH